MLRLCAILLPLCALMADCVAPLQEGTFQREDGWFGKDLICEGTSIWVPHEDAFLLSPYFENINYVGVLASCNLRAPSRRLRAWFFVNGVEKESADFPLPTEQNGREWLALKCPQNTTSVRIGVVGDYGTWRIHQITLHDDNTVPPTTRYLPAPTLTCTVEKTLHVTACAVSNAAEYVFALYRVEGEVAGVSSETFACAPSYPSSDWTWEVTDEVGTYTSAGYTDSDRIALKLESGTARFTSPEWATPIRKYSFMARTTDTNAHITIEGKSSEGVWQVLSTITPSATRTFYTNTCPDNIQQLRLSAATSRPLALDSLNAFYGGTESYTLLSCVTSSIPAYSFGELPPNRYALKAQALPTVSSSSSGVLPSDFSPYTYVDLRALAPTIPDYISSEVEDTDLILRWCTLEPTTYTLDLKLPGLPETYLVRDSPITPPAAISLPAAGTYLFRIISWGPSCLTSVTSAWQSITASVADLKGLRITATTSDTLSATWLATPFADSYRVELYRVDGPRTLLSTRVVTATSCTLSDIPPVVCALRVTPLPDADGSHGAETSSIDFSALKPLVTSPVNLSSCADDSYTENFAAVTSVLRKTSFVATFPHQWLLRNGEGYDTLGLTTGNTTLSGAYAYSTNILAILSTETASFTWGLSFFNDTHSRCDDFCVSYEAFQVSCRAASQTICVEYAITASNTIEDAVWCSLPSLSFTAPYTLDTLDDNDLSTLHAFRTTNLPNVSLPADAYLHLRWRFPAGVNLPLMGVSNLSLSFESHPAGFVLFIR